MIQSQSASACEIVLEVAGLDQRGLVVGEESAGPLLGGVLDAFQRGGVAVGLAGSTMSRSSEGTPALAKCAAMREPMVPAPRTATRRIVRMRL